MQNEDSSIRMKELTMGFKIKNSLYNRTQPAKLKCAERTLNEKQEPDKEPFSSQYTGGTADCCLSAPVPTGANLCAVL